MKTVELYARVRRAVSVEGMSRRAAAHEFGLARKTVSKMLEYSAPPGYRQQQPARRPKLGPWQGVIDATLEEDEQRPRKQRHTAKRIFERLRAEHSYPGGYTIVKDYVPEKKLGGREMFIPLVRAPGEAQADFDEAMVVIARVERKAQAFSELQSHYLFAEKFGRPAKGNDKGKVDILVGYARRNFMVPIPRAASWEELNAQLAEDCRTRRAQRLRAHRETIGERIQRDRVVFLTLPGARFEACDKKTVRVSSISLVRYRTNDYSAPTEYGPRQVLVKAYVHRIMIACGSQRSSPSTSAVMNGKP